MQLVRMRILAKAPKSFNPFMTNNTEMYSQVPPPPEQLCSEATTAAPSPDTPQQEVVDYSKPEHVSSQQWKKFQELKARREKECGKTTEKRKTAIKNKALRTVSQELSSSDKALLEEEGVSLPQHLRRKRKLKHFDRGVEDGHSSSSKASGTTGTTSAHPEKQWEEIKQYLDSNPQLKGVDKGRYATKSKLEEKLDLAVEEGQFEEAVEMSERLSQREFAAKLATAFDCHDYVKRKKMEEEKRKGRKQKLKWRFEHKQRWEMKGNM